MTRQDKAERDRAADLFADMHSQLSALLEDHERGCDCDGGSKSCLPWVDHARYLVAVLEHPGRL